ncbi:hypothetical protein JOC27_002581 [Sporolactobacillus spathodeae]|uniref:Uncharacterized protein n=1 Tax=Sporolactobacillus spathodeae TaxID=1465502 RepID=A0ABS2QCP9_9BACL|nr:hypothetical protein [Sporolactobacillus spathodeae]
MQRRRDGALREERAKWDPEDSSLFEEMHGARGKRSTAAQLLKKDLAKPSFSNSRKVKERSGGHNYA